MNQVNNQNNISTYNIFAAFAPSRPASAFVSLPAQKLDTLEKKPKEEAKAPELKDVKDLKDAQKFVKAKVLAATGGGVLLVTLGIIFGKKKNFQLLGNWFDKQAQKIKSKAKTQMTAFDHLRITAFNLFASGSKGFGNLASSMSVLKDFATTTLAEKIPLVSNLSKGIEKQFSNIANRAVKRQYKKLAKDIDVLQGEYEKIAAKLEKNIKAEVNIDKQKLKISIDNSIDFKEVKGILDEDFLIKSLNRSDFADEPKLQKFIEKIQYDGKNLALKPNANISRAEVLRVISEQVHKEKRALIGGFAVRAKKVEHATSNVRTKLQEHYLSQLKEIKKYDGIWSKANALFKFVIADSKEFNAELITKQERVALKSDLFKSKDVLSRTLKDNATRAEHLLGHSVDTIVEHKSVDALVKGEVRVEVKKLNKILVNYVNRDKDNSTKVLPDEIRQDYINQFKQGIETIKSKVAGSIDKNIKNDDAKTVELERLYRQLNNAVEVLENDKKGWIQKQRMVVKIGGQQANVLENSDINFLKKVIGGDYTNLKTYDNDVARRSTKVAKFETDNNFERQRDLKLGAGTSEVLGVVAPLSYIPISAYNAKTEQDKNRILTKQGLPVAGGVAGWVYTGMLKLFNAPRAMVFSLASGVVCSQIGSKLHKAYLESHPLKEDKLGKS